MPEIPPELPPAAIRDALDHFRSAAGWSWAEWSRHAGVHQSLLSGIFDGKRRLKLDRLRELAKAINKTPEAIYEEIARQAVLHQQRLFARQIDSRVLFGDHYYEFIAEQIATLDKGDFYVLVTAENPVEFDLATFLNAILHAVEKGAYFYYIFPPSVKLVPKGLRRYILRKGGPAYQDRYDLWLNEIEEIVSSRDDHRHLDVKHHIQYSASDDTTYFAPYIKYVLIGRTDVERSDETEEIPTGERGISIDAWIEVEYLAETDKPRAFLRLDRSLATNLYYWWQENKGEHQRRQKADDERLR